MSGGGETSCHRCSEVGGEEDEDALLPDLDGGDCTFGGETTTAGGSTMSASSVIGGGNTWMVSTSENATVRRALRGGDHDEPGMLLTSGSGVPDRGATGSAEKEKDSGESGLQAVRLAALPGDSGSTAGSTLSPPLLSRTAACAWEGGLALRSSPCGPKAGASPRRSAVAWLARTRSASRAAASSAALPEELWREAEGDLRTPPPSFGTPPTPLESPPLRLLFSALFRW